jgi:hypothetical protein
MGSENSEPNRNINREKNENERKVEKARVIGDPNTTWRGSSSSIS